MGRDLIRSRSIIIKEELAKKLMVTINFTKKKLYAYQYNGTMKKRCVFKNLSDKYGEP